MRSLDPSRAQLRDRGWARLLSLAEVVPASLLSWCVACSTSPAPMTEATTTAAPLTEAPRCPDAPANAWAVIDRATEGCPWIVTLVDETHVGVAAIETPEQVVATYELPAPCAGGGCELDGVETGGASTDTGPLLVLALRGEDTGHPLRVWVGIPSALGHRFVSTWREPDVRSDSSRIGPAFHLAPYRCHDGIALLAERRLDGEGDAPAVTTLAGEGYPSAIVDGEIVTTPLEPLARGSCVRLDVTLP